MPDFIVAVWAEITADARAALESRGYRYLGKATPASAADRPASLPDEEPASGSSVHGVRLLAADEFDAVALVAKATDLPSQAMRARVADGWTTED